MAKFIYKMQNILNIKYKLEEQAKTAYGEAQRRLDEEENKLAALLKRRDGYEDQLKRLVADTLEVLKIKQCEDALEIMKYQVNIQKISVLNAQKQLEAARLHLNEAMKERKIHEKLREKAFDAFLTELNAQENKEVDELVSYKYSKTSDGEDD